MNNSETSLRWYRSFRIVFPGFGLHKIKSAEEQQRPYQVTHLPSRPLTFSWLTVKLLSAWCDVRSCCVGPTACAKFGQRIHIQGDGWFTHHVWSWVKRWVSGTVSFSRRLFRPLNPRQENVSWHRVAPHGRKQFCFRGWGTRNKMDGSDTAAGRRNSDDVARSWEYDLENPSVAQLTV